MWEYSGDYSSLIFDFDIEIIEYSECDLFKSDLTISNSRCSFQSDNNEFGNARREIL